MKRWRRLIGPVLFFLFTASVVVMVGGFLKSKKIPAGAPTALPPKGVPAPAESAVVREAVVPVTEVAVGTIRSRTRVTVAPQVTARIASVLAEAGASVDKEKPLIALDDRELATRLAQAKEALAAAEASGRRADQSRAQAEARLVKGEARRDRVKGLFDK
jgi:multidrug efflux pump subunit AcrA (membrane-fusion protein)